MKQFVVKVVVLLVTGAFALFVIGSITMGYYGARVRSAGYQAHSAVPTAALVKPATDTQYQQALDRTWDRLLAMEGYNNTDNYVGSTFPHYANYATTHDTFGIDLVGTPETNGDRSLFEKAWHVNGTLYIEAPISSWYNAGADARGYAAHVILKVWAEELTTVGLGDLPVRVIVQDKQRTVIVTDLSQ